MPVRKAVEYPVIRRRDATEHGFARPTSCIASQLQRVVPDRYPR
jgi:hypothetical protein